MTTEEQLAKYRELTVDDAMRASYVSALVRRAPTDATTLETLLYILNEEKSAEIRLQIVKLLETTRPLTAIHALTKAMFDAEPIVRAHAALGVAGYRDPWRLAPTLPFLLDALADPATRQPAEEAIRHVTGRPSERITVSQREQIKLGDHPRTIWREYFDALPPPSD